MENKTLNRVIDRILEVATNIRMAEECECLEAIAIYGGWLKGYVEGCDSTLNLTVEYGGDKFICEWIRFVTSGTEFYFTWGSESSSFERVPFV